ncbi:hypothetical protein [Aquabacterium sp.]|uniref:hypothetical protein n=1 Tax=Aquabacterium sp. TaxID=1872578 RepID=UPI0025BFE3B6|nr:hypothetical protein [Aquabacterium sp.]
MGGGLARDWNNTSFNGANPVVNNLGQVAGTWANSLGVAQAFIYDAGSTTGPMALGSTGYATGINDAGQITVVRGVGPYFTTQVFDTSGQLIGTVGANNVTTIAWGINDQSVTTGRTVQPTAMPSGATVEITVPFSAATNGQINKLNVGSIYGGIGNALNNTGNIVGGSFQSEDANNIHAFYYASATGTTTDLAATIQNALAPGVIVHGSIAFGINDQDQITGAFHTSTGAEHAFLYSSANDIMDITANVVGNSVGYDIDEAGDVVGTANIHGSNGKPQFAFLYTKSGGLINLNQYAQDHNLLAPGEALLNAVSISSNGQYIAGIADINGKSVNYVMSMVPEPGTGVLLSCALGILGLARMRSKRRTGA